MKFLHNNNITSDSVSIQAGAGNSLIIAKPSLDFETGAFVVDSSRLAPKKVSAPIVKTVPYVPENDTINHPDYDVLTGDFVISADNSIASQLRVYPIMPLPDAESSQHIDAVEPRQILPAEPEQPVISDAVTENKAEQSEVFASAVNVQQALDTVAVSDDTLAIVADTVDFDTVSIANVGSHRVFEEKEGKPIVRKSDNFTINKTVSSTDWMLVVIVVSFVLFAWTRMIYGKFVGMVTQSAFNFYTAKRVYDESSVIRTRVFFALNILFYVNVSLFACQGLEYSGIELPYSGMPLFGICALAFFCVYTSRTIVLKILDSIFDTNAFGSYNFNIYLYNKMYGLILLPLVAAIPFVPDFVQEKLMWCGVGVYVLLYVCTLFRGLRICIKNRVSVFYLFFYLCALEILPLLTIYKFVLNCVL